MLKYQKTMNKFIGLLSIGLLCWSCASVPISGRRQLTFMPESQMVAMSITEYDAFLSSAQKVSANDQRTKDVKEVGQRIAKGVEAYFAQKGWSSKLDGYKWEFNLVNDQTVNAWCMPGGKVVVYTGILPISKTKTGLAVVMGHEIAHAVARHGNERMSQGMLVQGAGLTLDVMMSNKPQLTRDLFNQSFGVGSQLGMLAYGRKHETEADQLGLIFMAMAGYNPAEAPEFWKRMAALGGAKPPEILSTHPSSETRIKNLKAYLPEAQKFYKPK